MCDAATVVLTNRFKLSSFFNNVTGFGHAMWGIGSAVWTRRNTALLHVYFVSFTSFHYSYNHHAGASHTDFRRRSLSRHTRRLSRPRLSSPGRISRCRRRFRSAGQSAHHIVAVRRRGLVQRLTVCRIARCVTGFGGGGVCLAGVEAELWLHESWIAAYLPPLPVICVTQSN